MCTKTRNKAVAEGIAAGILFGTSAIFTRFLEGLDAFSITFWRLLIASLALLVITFIFHAPFAFNLIMKNLREILALSFFLSLHFIFFTSAVKDTTILNATVLVNTTPIFSAVISMLVFRLKPSRLTVLSLTVSFIGVCLIAYAETSSFQSASFSPNLKGDLEAAFAALLIAFYLNYGKALRGKTDLSTSITPIYLFAAVLALFLCLAIMGAAPTPKSVDVMFSLLGLGLIPTAAAHTLYFSSLSNLKSFEAATIALLEPIGATLLGIALFQEVPTHLTVFGAFLVLIGVAFIARQKE
ncbi:MAG: DMT family transporter [Candidatus Bathyarchaeia archaeon]